MKHVLSLWPNKLTTCYPKEIKTHLQMHHKNVHSSFTHDTLTLGTTQITIKRWFSEQTMYTVNYSTIKSNECWMNYWMLYESHNYNSEQKKPYTKENKTYESFTWHFIRQYKSIIGKNSRIVASVTGGEQEMFYDNFLYQHGNWSCPS